MKKVIKTDRAPQAVGPYSQAVEAAGFVFVSGQIPLDPMTGHIVTGGIREQTRQVLENAKAILSSCGCTMNNVVKVSVFLRDISDFGAMNEVYSAYFPLDPPARSTVEVSRLPKDASIEMDFIAAKGH